MKSFFNLIKTNRKFALYMVIFVLFLIWAWLNNFKIVSISMAIIVVSVIAFNLWKTR